MIFSNEKIFEGKTAPQTMRKEKKEEEGGENVSESQKRWKFYVEKLKQ